MSHDKNDKIYEAAKEYTLLILHEGMKRTRNEIGGVSLEEVSEIIIEEIGEDSKVLIDHLVAIYGYKFGKRLFQ